MKRDRMRKLLLVCFLFFGFLLGILFVNLWGDTYLEQGAFLKQDVLPCVQQAEISAKGFFFFLLKKRAALFFLFALLGYSVVGVPAFLLFLGWLGFTAGVFASLFFVQMQLMGMLFFLIMLLPHWLCYAASICIMAKAAFKRTCSSIYSHAVVFSGALLLLGMILESCVNPYLIRQTVGYFLEY